MSQVKKTMAQGFADGKDLYDLYTGIAQDLGNIASALAIREDVSYVFAATSQNITGSSGDIAAFPGAAGDLLLLNTSVGATYTAAMVIQATSTARIFLGALPPTSDRLGAASTAAGGYVIKLTSLNTGLFTAVTTT